MLFRSASGRLIVANPKDWTAWNRYAIAAAAASGTEDYSKRWQLRRDSHAAAYRAYQLATQPKDEAQALTTLADTYVFDNEQRTALIVLRSALKTAETPAARQLYERLRPEFGFKIDEFKVDSDASSPRACFTFTEDLKKADYAPYVAVSGLASPAITVETRQICVDGLEHGKKYGIVLRQGLPSAVGEDLLKAADYDVYVRDLASGETHLVSIGDTGQQGYRASDPSISATGRYVTFTALGSVIPGIAGSDGCDGIEVYVRDRDTDGNGVFDEPGRTATRLVSALAASGSTSSFPAEIGRAHV